MNSAPVYEKDIYSDAALADPFPYNKEIRDLGPVVKLKKQNMLVLSRYRDVFSALRSHEALVSGKGIGIGPMNLLVHSFGIGGNA
jgi:cytochrome P450